MLKYIKNLANCFCESSRLNTLSATKEPISINNPYPASATIIPKNIKKNGASSGVGSISLYLGRLYISVIFSNDLFKSLFCSLIGTSSISSSFTSSNER